MTKTVEFNYKGQMIIYYNKVKKNPKLVGVDCGFNAETGKYEVVYTLKNA